MASSSSPLTKVILELESKVNSKIYNYQNAAYVSDCADLEKSAKLIAKGIFSNAGQSAYTIQRLYVHEKVEEKFLNLLVKETKKWRIGDPMLQTVEIFVN